MKKENINSNKDKHLSKKSLVIINVFLLVVIAVLSIILLTSDSDKSANKILHDKNNPFLLTNPILDCEAENQKDNPVFFSGDLSKKIEQTEERYSLSHISLYFRDLNNGPWMGVNEKEEFSPASLLKVPVLIAVLREAQSNPSFLDKKIKIEQSDVLELVHQNITAEDTLVVGQEYTISEMIEVMIKKSDNTAAVSILKKINPQSISDVFSSVGVPYKDLNTEVLVRVKDYAGFFRVLFNSSYLNREMSEKALNILSKSEYKNGLVAGVPEDIVVAHKFGERSIGNVKQLHDCGIVYYPDKPYILCIMTRGDNFFNQEKAIKDLSNYVYTKINNNS